VFLLYHTSVSAKCMHICTFSATGTVLSQSLHVYSLRIACNAFRSVTLMPVIHYSSELAAEVQLKFRKPFRPGSRYTFICRHSPNRSKRFYTEAAYFHCNITFLRNWTIVLFVHHLTRKHVTYGR